MLGLFKAVMPREDAVSDRFSAPARTLVAGAEALMTAVEAARGAMTLFLATHPGVPISTTHTITGAIVGVGASRRVSAVRRGVAKDIVIARIVTSPAAALTAALFYCRGFWMT